MRYRLRTLLILLAVGPIALAVGVMLAAGMTVHPALFAVAIYVLLVLTLIAASWGMEWAERSPYASWVPRVGRSRGVCSYCGDAKQPLAEGVAGVLICRGCAQACLALLDEELQKRPAPTDSSQPVK